MILKSDVVFLIEEYTAQFGKPPLDLSGAAFPRRVDWERIVKTIRECLDSGEPLAVCENYSEAA